jgi:hypothetical protein
MNKRKEFPQNVKDKVKQRSRGRCECKRKTCKKHSGRCNGNATELHHITSVEAGGSSTLKNCEHLCKDCHKNTRSYGSH